MSDEPTEVHTIPVPHGWSVEQAWEAISRGDVLPDAHPAWANVLIQQGRFVYVYDEWDDSAA